MTNKELTQLFNNKSDCYADTYGEVILAMTAERFTEVVSNLIKTLEKERDDALRLKQLAMGESEVFLKTIKLYEQQMREANL